MVGSKEFMNIDLWRKRKSTKVNEVRDFKDSNIIQAEIERRKRKR